jgi:hypothetical protein
MAKPNIWIIDTSIFMNILDVENFNQDKEAVLSQFEERINAGDSFLLPFATIVETGNHIAQLNGNIKFTIAQKFVQQIRLAIENQTPYKALKFPDKLELLEWINDFPTNASQGIGFADSTIIEDWKRQTILNQGWEVKIWALDGHLSAYN